MRTIILLLTFWLTCIALTVNAATKEQKIYAYQLKNGLRLLVKPDHRAPVVISQVWYKVGSSYEPGGITGISHALEHMMFRGTKKYPAGEFSRIIARNGGQENAFTSYDYTAYFQELSADKLSISFKLEADRMRGLLLLKKDFNKEIQVVMEERRLRVGDNPQALTYERMAAAAHITSPYHHPVIGWMNDLENLKDKDLRRWYQTWYAPNNAIVVVVGDVDPEKVYQLAKKYFEPLKPSPLPEVKPQKALKPMGQRKLTVKAPGKTPWLLMAYNVPVLKTVKEPWQAYALDVLSGILDAGNSSRITTRLIRKQQIATTASAFYTPFSRKANLFVFTGTPAQGHTVKQLKQAFLAQIKLLQQKLVSAAELNRVKAQVIAEKVYAKDSISAQANEIGSLEAVGLSWQVGRDYVKNIQAVTPQQIQTVARDYLTPDRLTIAVFEPLPMQKGQRPTPRPQAQGARHVR